MPIPNQKKYTAEEFFKLVPETNQHIELRDGEIVNFASPNEIHQDIVLGLGAELKQFIKNKGGSCKPFVSPLDVVLDEQNVVQPDVFVVCDEDKRDGKRVNGSPDLVIEVLSTNRYDDLVAKLGLYQIAGVREYWIVDPKSEKTLVYFFEESDFPSFYIFEQPIPVGIYGGELSITIADIL